MPVSIGSTTSLRRSFALGATLFALGGSLGCTTTMGKGKDGKNFVDKVSDTFKETFNASYHDANAEAKMAEAEEAFAQQRYADAQPIYAKLADNDYNPSQICEKARYCEAECSRMQKHLAKAATIYNRYLQDFPGGVYSKASAEQMYAIAEVWLKDTLPELEKKDGKGWVRLPKLPNPFDATRPSLDPDGTLVKTMENIAVGAPNAPCADKAMFWAGYLNYLRGNYEDADHHFSTLLEMFKDSPLRTDAARMAIDAKNRSTGGPHYDGQKSAEALQLVHNIEGSEPAFRPSGEKAEWVTKQKLGIRDNQAEREFEDAEYYRRRGKFGSAFFCYELVKRRYGGTKYSDLASQRIEEMKQVQAQREADREAGKVSTVEAVQERLDRLVGKAPASADGTTPARRTPAPIAPATGFDGR